MTIVLYNVAGRKIRTLLDEVHLPGVGRTTWDGRNAKGEEVASGVYFCRMRAGKFTSTRKMILLR